MNSRERENPRLARQDGEWELVLERVLEHPREEVWAALTEAEQIPAWGPFAPDRDLTAVGAVQLAIIDMPEEPKTEGSVLEADAPRLLVYRWGPDVLRWELAEEGSRTVLTLKHRFADRGQAPSYAAGWHLCLDGLTGTLAGKRMPSMAGRNAFKFGWQDLYDRYADLLKDIR
jgi:uncharacterized protein YndB with AHSA1/START domain